jgi:hypothetical protein
MDHVQNCDDYNMQLSQTYTSYLELFGTHPKHAYKKNGL